MNVAYIYPEKIPSTKARTVSVMNSCCSLTQYTNVTLYVDADSLPYDEIMKNYHLEHNNLIIRPVKKTILFNRITSNKFFNKNLLRTIKKETIDIFFVRHLKTAEFLIRHKQANQKIVFECHEIFFQTTESRKNRERIKVMEDFVYMHADGLVFINQTIQQEFAREFANLADHQIVSYLGSFPPSNINLNKDFYNIDELFYIGGFYKWKGIETLIKSMQYIPNVILNIIGSDSPERVDEINRLITKLNLQEKIKLHGFLSNAQVKDILSISSKLVIIPNDNSMFDKFTSPLKLFECMSTYNAIIASDIVTIQEISNNSGAVLLFKAGDEKDLAKKIDFAIQNPDFCEQLAKKAFEKSKLYSWDTRAGSLIKFFELLIS